MTKGYEKKTTVDQLRIKTIAYAEMASYEIKSNDD